MSDDKKQAPIKDETLDKVSGGAPAKSLPVNYKTFEPPVHHKASDPVDPKT